MIRVQDVESSNADGLLAHVTELSNSILNMLALSVVDEATDIDSAIDTCLALAISVGRAFSIHEILRNVHLSSRSVPQRPFQSLSAALQAAYTPLVSSGCKFLVFNWYIRAQLDNRLNLTMQHSFPREN